MTVDPKLLLLFVGMGAVTYLPRWLPLFFLSTRKLPLWLAVWLDFIPVAVLCALILPDLVVSPAPRHVDFFRRELIVAIPTFLVALKTKSMGGAVLAGMVLYWLVGKVMG